MSALTRDEKRRDSRLRRRAAALGLELSRSHRQDPRAADYGTWRITRYAVTYFDHLDSLDAVETALDEYRRAGWAADEAMHAMHDYITERRQLLIDRALGIETRQRINVAALA